MTGPAGAPTATPAPPRPPEVIAHRGDPVAEVENTLASVRRAVADGASTIEIDVRVTADGAVVLLHDATTERIWGDPRPITDVTLAEVSALRTEAGHRVPTLAEALRAAAPARLLVDLPDAATARAAVAAVRATPGVPAPAWCGETEALLAVRALDADHPVAPAAEIWLTWKQDGAPPRGLVDALAPRTWNPEHARVTAASVRAAADLGMETTCWTVDDPARAAELAALGVAGIISNRAAAIRAHLEAGHDGPDR